MNPSDITLFVVEDDPSIRYGLHEVLTGAGYRVHTCDNGAEALREIAEFLPDLLVLDVMLPGVSGYEVARELRKSGCRIPILMLTAKGQEIDKVVGLKAGADDYVTKPFGVNELIARIEALLRRSREWGGDDERLSVGEGVPASQSRKVNLEPIEIGRATLDRVNYQLIRGGEIIPVTPRELELLVYLDQHRGQVLSRERILEAVWGVRYFGTTRALDQCVAQVRKKIGDEGRTSEFLLTVHGVGYKLV